MDLDRPLRVITPTLDGDVLAVLAAADVALTGRELQRRVGASQDGVRLVLDRLTREGVVAREQAGKAHLFRLNRRHLAAPCIEQLAGLRLTLIDRLRETISGWEITPVTAAIFGSVARGEARRESDLDIFVVRPRMHDPDDPVWRDQLMDLEESASAWTGNDTRVVEYGEAELRRATDPLLQTVAAEGVDLFGSMGKIMRASRRM